MCYSRMFIGKKVLSSAMGEFEQSRFILEIIRVKLLIYVTDVKLISSMPNNYSITKLLRGSNAKSRIFKFKCSKVGIMKTN